MFKKLFISFLFFAFVSVANSQQSKDEIQKRMQESQRQLNELNRTLSEIKKNKKLSIGQLELVKRKINAREELLHSLNKDLHLIENDIYSTTVQMNRLRRELDTLKQNYAKSLVFAYKNRSNYDYLNFIFSATNFNDAIKRIAYLKSYRQYRETQVANIRKTQQLLEQKAGYLNNTKAEKNNNIQEQNKQLTVLEQDKKEKDQVVKDLKGQEKNIAARIKEEEKNRVKMRQSLAAVIRREQDEAAKKERDRLARLAAEGKKPENKPAAGNDVAKNNPPKANTENTNRPQRVYTPFETTAEGLSSSLNFESNKGRLPWPVEKGYISGPFGTHEVPGTKLKESNDGIVIETSPGSSVKAVANGTVSSIFDLGEYQVVVIRHGKYITVYSRLGSVNVTKGQEVQAGTLVGKASTNDNKSGEIEFQVVNEKSQYLNPESWLRGR
ncbi:MAG: periplasmic septal ring factor with murein hydrolase EnvC/YibP [Chitinophagaceae bacterium]|nr:periplasmic septal ring factor with murein hydrolase EnvC/YibP [Chitinophagaceae bacterium]